ncbi:MAG: hypothetical protein ACRDAW_02475 [Metamycoplasmataceae bacterium]
MSKINNIKKERSLIFGKEILSRFSESSTFRNEYELSTFSEKIFSGINDVLEYSKNNYSEEYKDSIKLKLSQFKNFPFLKNVSFWDLFKLLVLNNIENKINNIDYTIFGYNSPEEVWDQIIEMIESNESYYGFSHFSFYFSQAYDMIIYSLARAMCINYKRSDFINFKYSESWLKNMNNYHCIYTTNYFIGVNHEMNNKIKFINGKFVLNNITSLNNKPLKPINIIMNEFSNLKNSNILFAENFEDKIKLNSILKWIENPNLLQKSNIINEYIEIDSKIVDIFCVEPEENEYFFDFLLRGNKIINIFFYSEENEKKWKKFLLDLNISINEIGNYIDKKNINIISYDLFNTLI